MIQYKVTTSSIHFTGDDSETQIIKDIADCLSQFGSFDIEYGFTNEGFYADCFASIDYTAEELNELLAQAVETVTGEDF